MEESRLNWAMRGEGVGNKRREKEDRASGQRLKSTWAKRLSYIGILSGGMGSPVPGLER